MSAQRPAIKVENLAKAYLIGHNTAPQGQESFREAVVRGARNFARSAGAMVQGRQILQGDEIEEFWALNGISLEISRGEVVGIIGRNGAGKSTLLKVLSRITEPTRGRVTIEGRVASLLEVGTGFHPELTGRENIFLNGAILGMTKAEIRLKFDDIVAFAEVERFLDTPVKRYSSGMYVRLAFSVAAHLEPEILVVDEVLAVGDAEFQKKCLGKMQNVAGEGRTVLFVSHNLQAVERLCTRAILLQRGQIAHDGPVSEACQLYMSSTRAWTPENRLANYSRQGSGEAQITDIEVLNGAGQPVVHLPAGKDFVVRIHYRAFKPIRSPTFGLALLTSAGARMFNTVSNDTGMEIQGIRGSGSVEIRICGLILAQGHFLCHLSICDSRGAYCDYLTEVPLLDIIESDALPKLRVYGQTSGAIFADCRWSVGSG